MRRKTHGPPHSTEDRTLPKYTIAVASDLSGVPQQQLRRMEESGLVSPARTEGKTRHYSDEDIAQIGAVSALAEAGINAAGIGVILDMQAELAALRAEVTHLQKEIAVLRGAQNTPGQRTDEHDV